MGKGAGGSEEEGQEPMGQLYKQGICSSRMIYYNRCYSIIPLEKDNIYEIIASTVLCCVCTYCLPRTVYNVYTHYLI